MSAKRKIITITGLALSILTAVSIIIVALNFRDYGIDSAKEKSKLTAELVRDGLTAHMINGMMDKREFFIRKVSHSRNINDLWIVRAKSVIDQFGPGLDFEGVRDSVDEKVLKEGKAVNEVTENKDAVYLRVTIPYTANYQDSPDCLSCHNAKDGEVLGAISMVIDVSEVRKSGLLTIIKIFLTSLIFLIITIYFINRYINPYLDLFDSLTSGIKKAHDGDFTHIVETNLKDEGGDVAKWLNELFEKLQETFVDIDKKISMLIGYRQGLSKNPLINVKTIIEELADIYKFKRTIEFDESRHEIYDRVIFVLNDKIKIKNFALYEVDLVSNRRNIIFATNIDEINCDAKVENNVRACRAIRINSTVYSDDFDKVCHNFASPNEYKHICIPFNINSQKSLLLILKSSESSENERIKVMLPVILNYLEAAKPVLESKFLMAILKESALKDGLTGLYNRKFLDEFVEKSVPQILRTNGTYSILMIDIDYFKMVNDTYGHDVGDIVIKGLADVLRQSIRESDLAIRFGGEEFMVLLYNADEEATLKVAEKIRVKFSEKGFATGKEQIKKTLSIGISRFPEDANTIWKVIKFADVALYKAKTGGRNRVVRFDGTMTDMGDDY